MRHAEKLIEPILFFDSRPIVSNLNPIHIGPDVEKELRNDLQAELDAVRAYNDGVRLTRDVGDNGTRAILESILGDEEEHVDWLEAQLEQIAQIGIQNYLLEPVD